MKTFKEFNEESRQSIDEKAGLIGAGLKALGKTVGKVKLLDVAKFGVKSSPLTMFLIVYNSFTGRNVIATSITLYCKDINGIDDLSL